MIKKYKAKRSKKKLLVFLVIIAIVLCAATVLYFLVIRKSDTDNTASYSPPTAEEKQQAEDHKEEIIRKESDQPAESPVSGTNVFITYAEQFNQNINASGYISGIIEEGGTCTLTLTKGSHTITRSKPALPDAKHTTCPDFNIPRGDIPEAGTWKITIGYSSDTTNKVSASQDIEIN